jgi:uncharacterized protein (TIGR03067 family)
VICEGKREKFKPIPVIIQGNKLSYPGPRVTYRLTLNPGKKPKQIDAATIDVGPMPWRLKWGGVYRLEGDVLTVCYQYEGSSRERPNDFNPAGTGLLCTFVRKKRGAAERPAR